MIRQRHHHLSRPLDLLSDRRSLGAGNGLLVAVENTGLERGVLSVAELLARRDQINVHLIGVSNPVTRSRAVTSEERADLTEAKLRRVHQTTRQLLHTTVGRGAYWSIAAALGTLPTAMAEEATAAARTLSTEIEKDWSTRVSGDVSTDVDGSVGMVVGKSYQLECGDAKVTIQKNGDITIEGKKIVIKGSGPIEVQGSKLKVKSDGTVSVDASGTVEVKGSAVNVN